MLFRLALTLIYLLPAVIAFSKNHRAKWSVAVGNALFGWTGVGWLVFLIIALDLENKAKGTEGSLTKVDSERVTGGAERVEEPVKSDHPEVSQLSDVLYEIRMKARGEVRTYANQALSQLGMLVKRHDNLLATLGAKLTSGELTYNRYQSASESVFNSILVSLSIASSLMRSVDGINSRYIDDRLESLNKVLSKHDADLEEIQTLMERKDLVSDQMQKISTLLTKNEVALTKLDKLNAALAEMNIVSGRVPSEFDSAIVEMERLVERVKLYDESPVDWKPKEKADKDKVTS